ncbi:general secretion pathway protein GspK [Humisphaera borealis]|uniref:General secretion pathway protein GspK n=1 Tax=Humisphaera borealis TaxID=2807512 RepID=A0A7M2WYB8_9BACT|nr:general secretion pathway protein GspK [Humisphaera borealis]
MTSSSRRHGTILVMVLWGMIVLTGIILVFGRTVQVEAISSNNRVSTIQTAAILRGAEQYVLSLVENAAGDPTYVVDASSEAMAVGTNPVDGRPMGYFWIIKPDTGNPELTAFGLVDESSKINLNNASRETLMKLPKMTEDIADSIIDWRDTDENVTNQGAESSYYSNLPQGYNAKNDRFEAIEELRLVLQPRLKDARLVDEFLYGYDLNHDGVMSARETSAGGMSSAFSSATNDGRGIAPFVTVYSVEANTNTGRTDVNGDSNQLRDAMRKIFQRTRADQIVQLATTGPAPPGGRRFANVFDFCGKGTMSPQEVRQAYDKLHANQGRTATGRVNLNTAPREVLLAMPGLEEQDVDKLLSARNAETGTSLAWVYEAIGPQKAAAIGSLLTNKSYQYSADIVAMSSNGKSFKRIRIIADARRTPARIVYRKDLSDLGWPLDESIRYSLQQGGVLDTPFGSGGSAF